MFVDYVSHHILSLLIFFPILAAIFLFCLPQRILLHSKGDKFLKNLVFVFVLLEFLFSLHLVAHFVPQSYDFQFSSISNWLALPGITYIVGIDGFSLYLVLLTTFISFLVYFSIYKSIQTRVRTFLACFLILEGTLIGAFVSLDLFLFYFFWEASLIPIYFMIGIWGGKDRIYATLKFFIYGVSGSVLMLVAFVYLYCSSANVILNYSSNLLDIYRTAHTLPYATQCWLFFAITLAFAIKVPLFPVYSWLSDVYEQAPAIYTMMSGVILKLATYGLVRLSFCLFPSVIAQWSYVLIILGLISILYGALIAWQQNNLRRIMAFSSLSHMGFIVVGIFASNAIAFQGAFYQMINHSITAAAFFILLQYTEFKFKTLNMNNLGGLASVYPKYGFFFVIVAMSAVGLPSTGSFLGEWLILYGLFKTSFVFGSIAILGVIFGAVYILWMTYKVIFGTADATIREKTEQIKLSLESFPKTLSFQLGILCVGIFVLGFASTQIFSFSTQTLLHIQNTALTKTPYQVELKNIENGELVKILR